MCYIAQCIAWSIDVIQRTITFCLFGLLLCVMCTTVVLSLVAGVAYGYNYMMAEFITHTRNDVNVYETKGENIDRPDLAPFGVRRSVGESDDFAAVFNASADDEESIPSSEEKQPLSEALVNTSDTKKYAERLTKFSKTDESPTSYYSTEEILEMSQSSSSYYMFTTPPLHKISILPNSAIETTVLDNGGSKIIMRNFPPVRDISVEMQKKDSDYYFYKMGEADASQNTRARVKVDPFDESGEIPDASKLDQTPKRYSIPMRHFESATDVDEDIIGYKPI